ncbi:MAG: uracil-DNA glycosylase [Kiritimatiellia bacterium]
MKPLGNDWDDILREAFAQPSYLALREFLKREYTSRTVYPPMELIYTALRLTPYASTKVVILGQDPYHEPGQAQGLAFSVPKGVPLPPSLRNIFNELESDLGIPPATNGNLFGWAKQGVLLLNTVLTVAHGLANSHRGRGWEILTDTIVSKLAARTKPLVFLLWGRNAQEKRRLITAPQHLILEAPHPSPLSASRGFFGCRHFSQANAFLASQGETPIDWGANEA